MRGLREITRRAGVALIVDEIQSGFGRTGKMFAFEHAGIEPDVVVLSKAIGGSLPLAVVVYHDDLDVWQPGAHAGTFRGNQLAMAAGTATLAYVREHGLAERAAAVGARMLDRLRPLATEFDCVGDVRGRGLMIGLELVDPEGPPHPDPDGPRPAAPELAAAVQRECLRRGLIVELGGRRSSVVRLLPPLTISDEQTSAVLDRLADAVSAVSATARGDRRHGRDGEQGADGPR